MRIRRSLPSLAGLAIAALLSQAAYAATILLDQPWNGLFNGETSIDGTLEQDVVDEFAASDDWTITSASWTGLYSGVSPGSTRDFVIEIFGHTGTEPTAAPLFTTTATATSSLLDSFITTSAYAFTGTFATPAFVFSGVDYYFSVTDAGPGASISSGMFWTEATTGSDRFYRSGDAGSWNGPGGSRAYTLVGEIQIIPEPSTASLLALGLVGIAAVRRRRTL